MKTRTLVVVASLLGLALVVQPMPTRASPTCTDPLGCVTIGPGDPIHIAYALVTEGPISSLGIDERNGIEIAIDDSGGQILAHDIRFDGVNSGCSSQGGLAAGQALAADASIVAVIGTSCSSAAHAAVPLLSAAGFVIVSPSNTAPDLTEPGNPNNYAGYLRTVYNDLDQGTGAAEYAHRQLGVTRAATIRDGSAYADYLQWAFADRFISLGGTITAQETINPDQTDMSAVLTSIATGAPELLYFPIFMPAGGHIISQTRTTAGLESALLLGSDALFTPDVVTAAGASIEGFMVTSPDLTQNSAEYYDFFLPAYQASFGAPSSLFHAHAYDAFMVIKAAIEQVAVVSGDGAVEIGRQALRDAMYATRDHPGLTGDLACSATGDCADPHIGVFRYHAGQFPPEQIWPQTRSSISPDSGGTVTSYDDDTVIQIPAEAITATADISFMVAHWPPPDSDLTKVGQMYAVTAVYSDSGQPAQIAPGHTYTASVQYTDAELGFVIESTLALYYWDGSGWVQEPSSVVDLAGNMVTATPSHFSRWAVLGFETCCDFDSDGVVDVDDIAIIAGFWNQPAGPPYDVDGDGVITVVDIQRVARWWGWVAP